MVSNSQLTKRAHWTGGIRRHLQAFSGFEFFLLPSRVHARPAAANANRWVLAIQNRKWCLSKNNLVCRKEWKRLH
jgi:hypothetical protein